MTHTIKQLAAAAAVVLATTSGGIGLDQREYGSSINRAGNHSAVI